MSNLREVSQDAFFSARRADPRDVMPSIVEHSYPYKLEWKAKDDYVFGMTKDILEPGCGSPTTHYYLTAEEVLHE